MRAPAQARFAVWGLGAAVVAVSALLGWAQFRLAYFDPDSVSYLFQAKLFAQGSLSADAPPEMGFSASPTINIVDGKWFSKYPFGTALMLVPGVMVGAPWLVPLLATGAAVVLLFAVVREMYGTRVALVAAVLGGTSPIALATGTWTLSEPISRLWLAVFLLGLIRGTAGRSAGYLALAGFALGYAFNTRPLTALVFAVAGAAAALAGAGALPPLERARRGLLYGLPPFALMASLYLAWNWHFTGDPLTPTYNVMQPYDRLGFGTRSVGYDPDVRRLDDFTPAVALKRLLQDTVWKISYNAFGWGQYHPFFLNSSGPFTLAALAGLTVRGAGGADRLQLYLHGDGYGGGRVAFRSRGYGAGGAPVAGASGVRVGGGGQARLSLRLTKRGDLYSGFFKERPEQEWTPLGSWRLQLPAPVEVGVYAELDVPRGGVEAEFSPLGPATGWCRGPGAGDCAAARGPLRLAVAKEGEAGYGGRTAAIARSVRRDGFDVATDLTADWRNKAKPWYVLWAIPLALPFALMAVPFWGPGTNRWDWMCLAVCGLALLCYGVLCYGVTPNARYYSEAIMLAMVPLVARGGCACWDRLGGAGARTWRGMRWGALVVLGGGAAYCCASYGDRGGRWAEVGVELPRQVAAAGLRDAVVFVHRHSEVPLGDYPFAGLAAADVVYFRLGPDRNWGLAGGDWRRAYDRYFRGRRAYLYENGRLRDLGRRADGRWTGTL